MFHRVYFGASIGVLPSGNKPLIEPMSTKLYNTIT